MPSLQLLCISGVVVPQRVSRPATVVCSAVCDFDTVFYDLSYCHWSVEHSTLIGSFVLMQLSYLCFAIHGDCLTRKVKWRHWLGEADFCCISSFAKPSSYCLQEITTIHLNLSKYAHSTVPKPVDLSDLFDNMSLMTMNHVDRRIH